MSPSYQTVPLVTPPKVEPSSTSVPMMKKVAVAAMVGTAFLAGSYVPRTTHIRSPTGSLSAMGDMSFLDSTPGNTDCLKGEAVASCKPGDEFWSVVGFPDGAGCIGDPRATMICGQICVNSKAIPFLNWVQKYAPEPKPVPGNCASHGYKTDTFMTFGLKGPTHGMVNAYANIFTK